MATEEFVSHCVLLNKNKTQKRSSGVGNLEFSTPGVWDFKLAFGQASGAIGDFTHISLIVLWLLFVFYFHFPPLLSPWAESVPNLLCNAVTQGLAIPWSRVPAGSAAGGSEFGEQPQGSPGRDKAQAQSGQVWGKWVRTHFPHHSQRPILREISVSKSKMLLECCLLRARMEFFIMIEFGETGVKNPSRPQWGGLGCWSLCGLCTRAPAWPSDLQKIPVPVILCCVPLPAHPKAGQEENIWQLWYCVPKELPSGVGASFSKERHCPPL